MNRRWAALGLMVGMLAVCTANAKDSYKAPPKAKTSAHWDESEAQRLEKFAISQCLIKAFPKNPVEADAKRASGAYVEMGSSNPEIYGSILEVVQAHRAKPYKSKSGQSLFVKQCLDLLHDPKLEALIRPGH